MTTTETTIMAIVACEIIEATGAGLGVVAGVEVITGLGVGVGVGVGVGLTGVGVTV